VSTLHQNVENGRFEIANFAQKCGFSVDKWVVEQISLEKNKKTCFSQNNFVYLPMTLAPRPLNNAQYRGKFFLTT
jgi:hypothetical protein